MKNRDCSVGEGGFRIPDFGVAAFAAVAALGLYTYTLGPTITGEDSGEFVVAAYSLGIPHPPGYPLYCLVGHLFCQLPVGEVAWRVNFMSAFFAAAAIFITVLLVHRLTDNRFAALTAGLALTVSKEFWAQAVIAEVYTMNAFWLALCLFLLLLWSESRRPRALCAVAVLIGLGVAVHNTFMLFVPPVAVFVWYSEFRAQGCQSVLDRERFRRYALCVLLAAATLLVYLYLPVRSRANPPLDWGNPETFSNLVRHVRRVQYDFMFSQYPRSVTRFLTQMRAYGQFWMFEFGPGFSLAGLVGLLLLFRRRAAYATLLVSTALLVIAGFSFWQNFEQTREWLWVMRVFGIPAYLITAVGLGELLATLWRRRSAGRAVAIVLSLSVICIPLFRHYEPNNKAEYFWTRDYGMNLLATLERDAVYVSESDHASFSLLYLQTVFGLRPDVENLRKYGYLSSELFREMPETLCDAIGPFPRRRHDPTIIAWILEHTNRPVYLARPMPLPDAPDVRFAPAGLAFRALRPGEAPSGREYWDEYRWHTLNPEDTRGDYTADAILHEINMTRAQSILMEKRNDPLAVETALNYIRTGLALYGKDPVALNNAGVLCARYALYEEARVFFLKALETGVMLPEINRNLARVISRIEEM